MSVPMRGRTPFKTIDLVIAVAATAAAAAAAVARKASLNTSVYF